MDASATEIDAAVALIEEWLIALAELGRGDAVEPPVDGVRSEVERREVERFAADLDGFVEGTEAEGAQRVEEGPGVADAEVEPTQVWPQAEVITLDSEQRGGLHTARALARAGGEPAPVGESPLAGRQRVTRGVPRPSCDNWVGSLERGRDVSPLGDDRTADDGSGPVVHRTDRVRTKAQPRVQHRGALRCLEFVPQRSQSVGVLLPRPLDTEGVGSRGEHRLADERVVDEEEEVRGESAEVTRARPPCSVPGMGPCRRPRSPET